MSLLHPLLQPTLDEVKRDAARAWTGRDATQRLGAYLTPWTDETTEDGRPMVTARVTGPHAEEAMRAFADGLNPVGAIEVRPQVDYSEPGVVACVWRMDGVWVRLWARDTVLPPVPTPLLMPRQAAGQPSGRLPYRRNTTTCGTRRDNTEGN